MVLGNGKKLTCCGDRNLNERKKAKYDYISDVVITKDNGAEMLTLSAITSAAIMLTVLALSRFP